MMRSRRCRPAVPAPRWLGCGLALLVSLTVGCVRTTVVNSSAHGNGGVAISQPAPIPSGLPLAQDVELRYILGPAAAKTVGYRVDWQQNGTGFPLELVEVAGNSIFTLDARNTITNLRDRDGGIAWRVAGAGALDRVDGITFVPSMERVYLTIGSELVVLDAITGSRTGRNPLEKSSNTRPLLLGQFLVYGSRQGQVVWHAHALNTNWRAYEVSQSINVPPVYDDGHIVAVGTGGRIMSLRADSASQVWSTRALDEVVAPPAVGLGAVYVSSLDQHVRAYSLDTRRSPLWEFLTESALSSSPVLAGERVYQAVPGEGLLCLEARPRDNPGGVVVWRCPEVSGSVVVAIGQNLITWDPATKQLSLIEARRGTLIESMSMPEIASISTTDVNGGTLYVTDIHGRIERLVPR